MNDTVVVSCSELVGSAHCTITSLVLTVQLVLFVAWALAGFVVGGIYKYQMHQRGIILPP